MAKSCGICGICDRRLRARDAGAPRGDAAQQPAIHARRPAGIHDRARTHESVDGDTCKRAAWGLAKWSERICLALAHFKLERMDLL